MIINTIKNLITFIKVKTNHLDSGGEITLVLM